MEFQNNIIGVEGHSFSGKTYLLNDLKERYKGRLYVIAEHDVYAGGAENFPKIPFKSYKLAKEDARYFLNLEIKRFRDALTMFKKYKTPILFDRTILSVILFQKYLNDKKKGWINAFEYSLDLYQNALEKNQIFIPTKLIYMEPIDDRTFLERTGRGVSVSFYKKLSTLRYMTTHYNKIVKNKFPGKNHLFLKSGNAKNTLNKNKAKAFEFAIDSDIRNGFNVNLHKLFTS